MKIFTFLLLIIISKYSLSINAELFKYKVIQEEEDSLLLSTKFSNLQGLWYIYYFFDANRCLKYKIDDFKMSEDDASKITVIHKQPFNSKDEPLEEFTVKRVFTVEEIDESIPDVLEVLNEKNS